MLPTQCVAEHENAGDQYIDNLSTNELNGTCLELNVRICTASWDYAGTFQLHWTPFDSAKWKPTFLEDIPNALVVAVSNSTGFGDEAVVAVGMARQSTHHDEDALNTSSLYAGCDLSLRDSLVIELPLPKSVLLNQILLCLMILAANRPLENTFDVWVEALT